MPGVNAARAGIIECMLPVLLCDLLGLLVMSLMYGLQAFLPLLGTDLTLKGKPGKTLNISSIYASYTLPFSVCPLPPWPCHPAHAGPTGQPGALIFSPYPEFLPWSKDYDCISALVKRHVCWALTNLNVNLAFYSASHPQSIEVQQ